VINLVTNLYFMYNCESSVSKWVTTVTNYFWSLNNWFLVVNIEQIPHHRNLTCTFEHLMMPRAAKFSFVGNLSRKSLQTKIDTFSGTCLFHKRSSAAAKGANTRKSRSDKHPWLNSICLDLVAIATYMSGDWTCKRRLWSKT
jgi:hypothetical protein